MTGGGGPGGLDIMVGITIVLTVLAVNAVVVLFDSPLLTVALTV